MIDVSIVSENGRPRQRHAVGTFDVCLARPKNCPVYIVRPHAAQLMIDRTVDHFCLFSPLHAVELRKCSQCLGGKLVAIGRYDALNC